MSFFNRWGIGSTVVVELLVLLALAFAVVRYVEWSSDAAMTEFMSAIDHRRMVRIVHTKRQRRISPPRDERPALLVRDRDLLPP